MGYNSYLAVGTGLEDRMDTSNWPNSDYEMVKTTVNDYINNEKITFSAGISTYDGKSSIYKWLDQADKALYQAKKE